MVRHFQGRGYIWLENSELLLCPIPVFCQANISAKILGGCLFCGSQAHQRPMIIKSFAIFCAECVSHPQEHQILAALCQPHSCPPQFCEHGGGKMSTGCIPLQPTSISTGVLAVRTRNKPKSPPEMMPQHWPQMKGSIRSSVCHL